MGWLYMLVNAAAVVAFYGVKPNIGFGIALTLLAVSFTTFCLLYDRPVNRARDRMTQRLGSMSGKGIDAQEYQRLQSMKVTATEDDMKFRLTAMSGINIASGVLGAIVLAWGLYARFA